MSSRRSSAITARSIAVAGPAITLAELAVPLLLGLAVLFWLAGFDIIYATLDEDFDRRERLYSFVSRFGKKNALMWSSIFHLIAFAWLALLFATTIRTWYAAPFLVLTGALLWFEQRKAANSE